MDENLDIQIEEALKAYLASGVEDQVDYQKFYLYSIVTHSTAIEGSTVTEIENQLLFDEGIAAKGRSLTEQMMNVDLKDAYLHAFRIASENPTYTPQLLQQLSALVMRRTGSEYSTVAGQFDSSKGEFRLCNVSAGIGGRSYLAYNKVPRAVEEFCQWLNDEIANIDKADIASCYRLSFETHFRLGLYRLIFCIKVAKISSKRADNSRNFRSFEPIRQYSNINIVFPIYMSNMKASKNS
ncbi:MAG: hypothetical protein K2M54_03110 [Muribaculaceae bacterium]|nr:hypothetical protein [Muribaculaceae bacterium]